MGKARPRLGKYGNVYKDPKTGAYLDTMREYVRQAMQSRRVFYEGPVRMDVLAIFPRPKYRQHKNYPDGFMWNPMKPDRDNVDKMVLDGLTAERKNTDRYPGIWKDDNQVVAGEVFKIYARRNDPGRVLVRIEPVYEGPSIEEMVFGVFPRDLVEWTATADSGHGVHESVAAVEHLGT